MNQSKKCFVCGKDSDGRIRCRARSCRSPQNDQKRVAKAIEAQGGVLEPFQPIQKRRKRDTSP